MDERLQEEQNSPIRLGNYKIDLDEKGFVIVSTDYHAGPLRISWEQIREWMDTFQK